MHFRVFDFKKRFWYWIVSSSGGTYSDGHNKKSQSLSPETSKNTSKVYKAESTQTAKESDVTSVRRQKLDISIGPIRVGFN
jgi:hypothetical protein